MRLAIVLLLLGLGSAPAKVPLIVADMSPAPDAVLTVPPTEILVTLNNAPDVLSVNATSVIVTRAGVDGNLGTGDDVAIIPASITVISTTVIRADLTGALLPDDLYRVQVRGAEVPISGLVSHWKLDESGGTSAADSSGGGLTGTLSGASWVAGRIGNGLSFNGVADRVTLSGADIPVPWTAAMWVYRLNSPYADARVTDNLVAMGTSLRLEQYNNTNQCGYTQGGVGDYLLPYTATVGAWTHLTWVGTASGVSLHANGSGVASNGVAINLSRGTLGSAGGNSVLGTLDDVRIYNRALLGSEILTLARLGGAVRDVAGALLDGELTAGLPSGNGSEGGDFVADFVINTLAPVAPSALTAQPGNPSGINLAWSDNSSFESGFSVERGTDGVAFSEIGTTGADAAAFTDPVGNNVGPFFYRVRATSGAGNSGYSNIASASASSLTVVTETEKKCGSVGVDLMIPLGLFILWRRIRRR